MMLIVISLWVAVALFLFIGHVKRQKEITSIIEQSNTFEGVTGSRAVIDSESFDVSYKKKVKDKFKQLKKLLSPNACSMACLLPIQMMKRYVQISFWRRLGRIVRMWRWRF